MTPEEIASTFTDGHGEVECAAAVRALVAASVDAERERCARICKGYFRVTNSPDARLLADLIRE
jgi:hypothetical protein